MVKREIKEGKAKLLQQENLTFSSIDSLRKKDPKGFKLRNVRGLSDRVGAVEIVLFKDRVVGSHLTKRYKEKDHFWISSFGFKNIRFWTWKLIIKIKQTEKKVKKELLKLKPPFNDVKKVLNKYPFKKVLKYDLIVIDEIVRALKDIYKYSKEREGEERFYKKSEIKNTTWW